MPTNDKAYQIRQIRIWFVTHDLSIRRLAPVLGISKQYLGFILRGERRMPQDIRRRLVEEYSFPIELVPGQQGRRAA